MFTVRSHSRFLWAPPGIVGTGGLWVWLWAHRTQYYRGEEMQRWFDAVTFKLQVCLQSFSFAHVNLFGSLWEMDVQTLMDVWKSVATNCDFSQVPRWDICCQSWADDLGLGPDSPKHSSYSTLSDSTQCLSAISIFVLVCVLNRSPFLWQLELALYEKGSLPSLYRFTKRRRQIFSSGQPSLEGEGGRVRTGCFWGLSVVSPN